MIKKALILATAALCLTTGASAFAQSSDYRNDRNDRSERYERSDRGDRYGRNDRYDQVNRDSRDFRDHNRDGRVDYRDDRDNRYSRDHQRYDRDDRRGHNNGYVRGAGPRHDFYRGGRLSNDYRHNRYVVTDWRSRRLSAPPRGYHWVQAGDDYLMVAIATGIIAHVLLNN